MKALALTSIAAALLLGNVAAASADTPGPVYKPMSSREVNALVRGRDCLGWGGRIHFGANGDYIDPSGRTGRWYLSSTRIVVNFDDGTRSRLSIGMYNGRIVLAGAYIDCGS